VREGDRRWLINVMEGVEDIPGSALSEGIRWEWESFPEYLDALDRFPRAVDVVAQVPHGSLRAYVMGERAIGDAPPTEGDIAEMARLVREAMLAGAIGFSTTGPAAHPSTARRCRTFAEEASRLANRMAELARDHRVVTAGSMGEDINGHERLRCSAVCRSPLAVRHLAVDQPPA
jgi:N-acyl-D-aspartate/D-glutamate deacylase